MLDETTGPDVVATPVYSGSPRALLFASPEALSTFPPYSFHFRFVYSSISFIFIEIIESNIFTAGPGAGLVLIQGCEIYHTLQTHQTLRNAVHLLRENEIVGEWDVIPGIVRIPVEDTNVSLNQ